MNGTDSLGGAYLRVGADINPLIQKLQAGQREVNTTMQRMGTSVKRFSLDIGGGLSKAFGFAGFVGAAGTMALATREAVKQLDAQKRLSVAVGTLGLDYRKTSQAVAEYTETAKRSYALGRAQAMDLASTLIQQGKFTGEGLKKAYEAALGLSTLGGTSVQEAAQFLIGAKFGQPTGAERFGLRFAQGGPGGAHLEDVMAAGRRGLGIQRELAQLPQERGRRALVDVLDRLANALVGLVGRFGVIDDMLKKRPAGAPGILEPGESPLGRAAADVGTPRVMKVLQEWEGFRRGNIRGPGGAEQMTLEDYWRWKTSGGYLRGRNETWPMSPMEHQFHKPNTGLDWMLDDAAPWIRSSLDQLDEATQPDPFNQADILERAAGARSNIIEAAGGGTPEQRAEQGGVGPYLQTSIDENTKAVRENTDMQRNAGGLQ